MPRVCLIAHLLRLSLRAHRGRTVEIVSPVSAGLQGASGEGRGCGGKEGEGRNAGKRGGREAGPLDHHVARPTNTVLNALG
eukprot:2264912-Rhodomonas_salina.1